MVLVSVEKAHNCTYGSRQCWEVVKQSNIGIFYKAKRTMKNRVLKLST